MLKGAQTVLNVKLCNRIMREFVTWKMLGVFLTTKVRLCKISTAQFCLHLATVFI